VTSWLLVGSDLLDLWHLKKEDTSQDCTQAFEREWRIEARKPKPSLSNTFYRAFGFDFTVAAFYKAAQDVLGFAG
jgi:hypothetical protein